MSSHQISGFRAGESGFINECVKNNGLKQNEKKWIWILALNNIWLNFLSWEHKKQVQRPECYLQARRSGKKYVAEQCSIPLDDAIDVSVKKLMQVLLPTGSNGWHFLGYNNG